MDDGGGAAPAPPVERVETHETMRERAEGARDYWENWKTFQADVELDASDALKRIDQQERFGTLAPAAAEAARAAIETDRENRLADIRSGPTYELLTKEFEEQRAFAEREHDEAYVKVVEAHYEPFAEEAYQRDLAAYRQNLDQQNLPGGDYQPDAGEPPRREDFGPIYDPMLAERTAEERYQADLDAWWRAKDAQRGSDSASGSVGPKPQRSMYEAGTMLADQAAADAAYESALANYWRSRDANLGSDAATSPVGPKPNRADYVPGAVIGGGGVQSPPGTVRPPLPAPPEKTPFQFAPNAEEYFSSLFGSEASPTTASVNPSAPRATRRRAGESRQEAIGVGRTYSWY